MAGTTQSHPGVSRAYGAPTAAMEPMVTREATAARGLRGSLNHQIAIAIASEAPAAVAAMVPSFAK